MTASGTSVPRGAAALFAELYARQSGQRRLEGEDRQIVRVASRVHMPDGMESLPLVVGEDSK